VPSYEYLQSSFAGGEMDPRLRGRVESDLYKKAAGLLANWQPTLAGSILLRRGTQRRCGLSGLDLVRNIQYRSSLGPDAMLVLGDRVVSAYYESGQKAASGEILFGSVEHIVNGSFAKASFGWTAVGAAKAVQGAGQMGEWVVGSTYVPGGDTQWWSDFTSGAWQQNFVVTAGPCTFRFRISSIDGIGAIVAKVGTRLGGGEILTTIVTGVTSYNYLVQVPAGTVYVEFSAARSRMDGVHGGTPNAVTDVSFVGAGGTQASATTPWTLDMLADVQYVTESSGSGDRMFFFHPSAPPQALVHAADGSWTFGAAQFVGAPAEWAGTNWPACGDIYQGRLVVGATPGRKNGLWASRAGDLLDFRGYTATDGTPAATSDNGATITDECAITAPVATKGAIGWIRGQRELLLGCDDGEVSVTAVGGILSPKDFQTRQESAFGAAALQPLVAGSQVLFVSRDRRKVRAMRFVRDTGGMESPDVSFPGAHLLAPGVLEIHWAREPIGTIVCLLADGTLACYSYEPTQEIDAPWRIEVDGIIRSLAVANGEKGATLWLSIQRDGALSLETLPLYDESDADYLDAHVTGPIADHANPAASGLDHLVGRTARVVIDGSVEADMVVPAGGQLALPRDGAVYTVGLAYPRARAQTLPPEGGNPAGTAQRAQRRFVRLMLRLNDSALPLVNGQRAPERTPSTPMDTAEPRVTGDVVMDVDANWEDQGVLTLDQDLPLRTEILALFGKLALGEL
jgi:hypothetical protein